VNCYLKRLSFVAGIVAGAFCFVSLAIVTQGWALLAIAGAMLFSVSVAGLWTEACRIFPKDKRK